MKPKVKISLTRLDWALEAIAFLIWFGGLLFIIINFSSTPDQVPTHYDYTGTPTTLGSKNSLWLLVGTGTSLYVLLSVVSLFPHTFNYPVEITPQNSKQQYTLAVRMIRTLKIVVLMVFGYIQLITLQASRLGGWFLPVFVVAVIGVIGLYIWKARSASLKARL